MSLFCILLLLGQRLPCLLRHAKVKCPPSLHRGEIYSHARDILPYAGTTTTYLYVPQRKRFWRNKDIDRFFCKIIRMVQELCWIFKLSITDFLEKIGSSFAIFLGLRRERRDFLIDINYLGPVSAVTASADIHCLHGLKELETLVI